MMVPKQRADPPFVGHPGPVLAVAVTPDGTKIITAGADGSATRGRLRAGVTGWGGCCEVGATRTGQAG